MATRADLRHETENSVSRITREGKKITYRLNVLQHPERARACGQGKKSHADRRPVDPPPVVEMRIFESDCRDEGLGTDITFIYNANFFLFATLVTTPTPPGEPNVQTTGAPVLSGVPVAGVAYLDKPTRAGYFIFPDLSVRNEGWYRLIFHLYEQTKDPKDMTEGPQQPVSPPVPGKVPGPQQWSDFRLEVVTAPFLVSSAKKFPGLAQSTALSRMIADQGCRVRIRRDVRMRRRGDKRPENYDYDEERGYRGRADRYATPDTYANAPERPRSTSISTVDPYYSQRRPSGVDYQHPIPPPYQRPMPPTPGSSSTPIPHPIAAPHAGVSSAMPSPVPAHTHAPAIPPAPMAGPPPAHTPSYQSSGHLSFVSTQAQYPPPPPSHVPQPVATPTKVYYPRPSISHGRNPSISAEYEPMDYPNSRLAADRPSYQKPPQPNALPPLRRLSELTPPGEPHYPHETPGATRTQTKMPSLPPINTVAGEFTAPTSQPSSSIGSSPGIPSNDYGPVKSLWETNPAHSKRTHEESFGYDERPLHNFKRPDVESYPSGLQRRPSYERSYVPPPDQMAYKRANGSMASKPATMNWEV
ncbi:velvet factor-domain-containing protein [Aspergillus unguis]